MKPKSIGKQLKRLEWQINKHLQNPKMVARIEQKINNLKRKDK